jgi:hypothetical protein
MEEAEKWYWLGERILNPGNEEEKEGAFGQRTVQKDTPQDPESVKPGIFSLLHAQPADIMQNMLGSEGTADAAMGEYHDKMD